jgi:hypothetical protein
MAVPVPTVVVVVVEDTLAPNQWVAVVVVWVCLGRVAMELVVSGEVEVMEHFPRCLAEAAQVVVMVEMLRPMDAQT